jgi:hypothetical protein
VYLFFEILGFNNVLNKCQKLLQKLGYLIVTQKKIWSNDYRYFGTLNEREKKISMNTNLRKNHF